MTFELIYGPMYSGKTLELIRRLSEAEARGLRVVAAKPSIEDEPSFLVSLAGPRWPAIPIARAMELPALAQGQDVVGIDELQFVDEEIVEVLTNLRSLSRVIGAGLDLDFRGEPFGPMPALVALADESLQLTAVCDQCGAAATRSQRLLGGRPASRDSPVIQIGRRGVYEARCERCHVVR